MEKMKNIFGRNMAKLLVFLIGGILVLGLLSYGLLTLSKTVSGQGHKIEICTYYQDNSTKNLSNSAGTISVNGNISDSVQGRVGSSVSLSATPNENYQFMGFYRDLEFTDVISRDSSCVYEISAEDEKIFAQFLKVYPVTFTFQDANVNTHTITKKFPYGYTFGQEEIKELIEKESGEAGLSVFENKLAKLNPSPETATDTTSTNMCFTVGSGASFFNLTPVPLDDVGISGSGTSASPYLIANATDLATFRDTVNGTNTAAHAKLTANITLSGNWTPIGNASVNSAYKYSGTFDGQFYSISGLSLSASSWLMGLFGAASGAVIKNLKINGGSVSFSNGGGGACVGDAANHTKLINVTSTCSISSTTHCFGGICGSSYGTQFINCFNGGKITSTLSDQDCEMAGICGISYGNGTRVYNCYNYGAVNSGTTSEKARGGIVGESQTDPDTYIVNCYSMSGVAGNKVYGTGSANSTSYNLTKGNALFNSSTQIITPFDSGVTTRYVYNIATDAATSMPATTTLLEALNKFVELNPVMEGVKLSPYYIATTYPEFALMGEVTYNANGGTRLSETAQTYLKPTTTYTTATILPVKGKVFTGWYTAISGGTEITNDTALPTAYFNQTLYARFASYSISGGGSGTEADPYIIKTEQDFIAYRDWINSSSDNSGLCAKLGNDITLTKDWVPIGNHGQWSDANFTGVFDGDFHKISGLQIESDLSYQGLFGRTRNAIIKNLKIVAGEIVHNRTNVAYSAAICGYAIATKFINCLAMSNISSNGQELGGVCGRSDSSTYMNCVNGGNIYTTQADNDAEIGGIVGLIGSSDYFYNCFNYGYIESGNNANLSAAGVVGENYSGTNAQIFNCYSMSGMASNKVYSSGSNGVPFAVNKGNALFNEKTQILIPFDESATGNYVYNIETGQAISLNPATTLVEALNKFVEINPVIKGERLVPWAIGENGFPDFVCWGSVNFNANGGSGAPPAQTSNTQIVQIPNITPVKSEHTFLGWSINPLATTASFLPGESYEFLGNVTLYAVWARNYVIEYNGNGATSGTTASSVHTVGFDKALTTNGFVRTGYSFQGWARSSAATTAMYTNGQSVKNLDNNEYGVVTLYAVWQGNSYTVHYDANGGSGSMENSSHVYGTESELSVCTFTKEGYVFLGWSTRSDATSHKYNDEEIITNLTATNGATVTLYAIWLKKDITVTVDPNGGVYNGVETATVYNCSVGSDLVLGVPSRPGYEFTEFNTQGDGLGQTLNGTMVLNGDVTFYALWEPLNYYIKYYDGDLYLGQTEAWYNENLSLPRWETLLQNNSLTGGKFTQYGWNFAGWTADANGTAVQHTNGGAVMNLTEAGTTINLYAMHTQTLNLTYNGNGSTSGNVSAQSSDLMLNSKSEKLAEFVIKLANNSYAKTNYSFKNWAIGSTSGTQKTAGANITNVDLGLTYSSTFNITIYAIWQGNSYTINYYNGTEKIATENYVYGTSATLKNFSTIGSVSNLAYGWEFYGWATANNTFTRVFEDSANITNISVENGSEITQNMAINLYSIYSREVSFVSGLNKASTTTATQFWNPYSTNNSNLSSVLAEAPQTIETGNWTALGYRTDITASTATFVLTTTTEIRPAVNAFNTLYAVYSRTITIADLNTTTTATQYYNSAGTVSTVGQ